ncbi:MAG: LrgB family protein [Aristaeellaceae bacterium]
MTDFLTDSSVWGTALTLAAFALGTFLHGKIRSAWCNPLLWGSIFVILVLSALDIPYSSYRDSAGPLTYLLFPATVSLAIPLYEQWALLKKHLLAILAGIAAGVITSVCSILALAWLFRLDAASAVSLLPKSVTTAIGVDIATELGGIPALTTAVIILTGIIGNLLAAGLCGLLRLTNPIARGIAIGTSSHAIGTSKALEMGPVEGAMSSLSIAVAGILTAVLCPLLARLLPV